MRKCCITRSKNNEAHRVVPLVIRAIQRTIFPGGACGGAVHPRWSAQAQIGSARERDTPGERLGVLRAAYVAVTGMAHDPEVCPTDRLDHNGPGNEGAEMGRREGSAGGHHRSLHAAAYF